MVSNPFNVFSPEQRRNVAIYIIGIMLYKFGLEYFNGAFITMANERFGKDRYTKIGILTGMNAAAQCVGSIIVAPLIKRLPTRTVLSAAVLMFGLISAILLIVDASTGGKLKYKTADNVTHYGNWNPNGLFPVYIVSGFAYGMIELIRRVIPRDIVGGDIQRLRYMDAVVHVLYEVAGTIGAFTSTTLIGKFGYNNSYLFTPIFFGAAAIAWRLIGTLDHGSAASKPVESGLEPVHRESVSVLAQMAQALKAFGKAFYLGMFLVFSHRRFVWLVSGYSFALYGHRFLENQIAPILAKQYLNTSAYSQIMVGGSNFGELLGALSVALFTNFAPTPIPWLRLDALLLQIVWVLPFFKVVPKDVKSAWQLAGIFVPISFGWAAGDVSLAAYIQGTLARLESTDEDVSVLGAVMAFLYVTYIIIYAVLSAVLGSWVDRWLTNGGTAKGVLIYIGGVQYSVLCVIMIASTLVPRGAFSLNPQIIDHVMPTADSDSELEVNMDLDADGNPRTAESYASFEKPHERSI